MDFTTLFSPSNEFFSIDNTLFIFTSTPFDIPIRLQVSLLINIVGYSIIQIAILFFTFWTLMSPIRISHLGLFSLAAYQAYSSSFLSFHARQDDDATKRSELHRVKVKEEEMTDNGDD